jgi:membrane associated rhomboid family serine protease
MREYETPQATEEMARLDAEMKALERTSVMERYAFFSHQRDAMRYITASFLHGGIFHLLGNMWFLWLAGTVIEDKWGRLIYPVFYALACWAALLVHAVAHPDSIKPVLGASGAVAALMGAFLVRFATTRINFIFLWWFGFRPYWYKFKAPAYTMLPLWAVAQILWGALLGENGGVAYWAHVGGFGFGVVAALGMKFSGLETKVDAHIEKQVGWSMDPRVVKAGEIMQKDPQGAVNELLAVIGGQKDSLDAWNLLSKAYWQQQNLAGHREALGQLARLHIRKRELDAALENYDEFRHSGGEKFPAAEWLALCRHLETIPSWERAAAEYENYAAAYPQEKMAVYALVAAARINLKNLSNRAEAARLYRAAEASPVPHLDYDDAIRRGLRDATLRGATPQEMATAGSLR